MNNVSTKKMSIFLLPLILVSYLVVGFPDGSFTISWDAMAIGLGLLTWHSGIILVGYSVTYTLAGVILAWLNRFMKLQSVYLMGLVIMGAGFVGLAFSPNFAVVTAFVIIYGFGTGAMASSMNAYMAKHFTAKQNNYMHFFWGAGAAISPLIMGRFLVLDFSQHYVEGHGYMIDTVYAYSWTTGYLIIASIVGVVGLVLLLSMSRNIWINEETENKTDELTTKSKERNYLSKKWHQAVEILTFFFLGGTDYTVVFFTSTVFMVVHGLSINHIAIFSTVYYIGMTAGRFIFGWAAKYIKETTIIRIGVCIAVIGILTLWFATGIVNAIGVNIRAIGIIGIAITGLGLGPLLPTLVSDTSNRFSPKIISKLVGFELAAFGAGIAVLFFITSMVLTFTTYMALFPIVLTFVVLVFVCNEILIKACGSDSI